MAQMADQGPVLMVRVMATTVQILDFRATAARVVIISRVIRGINSSISLVIRATRSSSIVGSIMSSPLAYGSEIRSFIRGP